MYQYNQEYPEHEFDMEQPYQEESEYELLPELELESEDEMESGQDFEQEDEFDEEQSWDSNQEMGEMENDFESEADELEAELEYVTNDQEFSNWVNEIVVRDHRRGRGSRPIKPILRTPIGQRAVKHLSRIAFRTLPFIGRRSPHWRGRRYRRPYHYRRPAYGTGYNYWNNMQQGNQPYEPQQGYGADAQQPAQPDGSFKNFVLDTLKNLSQQIAQGNDTLAALKSSMASSAAQNFPSIVQPKGDAAMPQEPQGPPPAPGAGTGEMQFEDFEFDEEAPYDQEHDFENEGGY